MPASSRSSKARSQYDRWTFDHWTIQQQQDRRRVLRRRFWLWLDISVLLLGGLAWAWDNQHPRAARPVVPHVLSVGRGRLTGVIVILDPGHGGADPGASLQWGRQPVREAALTYRTALEVADVLRGQGADVRYTVRSHALDAGQELSPLPPPLPVDAVLVSTSQPLRTRVRRAPEQLWQRAVLAREIWSLAARTDPMAARDVFFLSLHFDDMNQSSVHGGLVCVDRRAGAPPAFGLSLARSLAARGWARAEQSDGQPGLSERELGVLNPLYNPVPQKALLEVTTLSNMDDFLRASDPAWRAQIAQLIAQSVADVHRG